jgi:hypothetical protein
MIIMNVPCEYKLEMFELLEHQPCVMSLAQLSRALAYYFRENSLEINLPEIRYINMACNTTKLLTGYQDDQYILMENGVIKNDWWDLVKMVSERWKLDTQSIYS